MSAHPPPRPRSFGARSSRAQRWSAEPGLLHHYPTRLMLSLVGCLLLVQAAVWMPVGDYTPQVGWHVQDGPAIGLADLAPADRLPPPTVRHLAVPSPFTVISDTRDEPAAVYSRTADERTAEPEVRPLADAAPSRLAPAEDEQTPRSYQALSAPVLSGSQGEVPLRVPTRLARLHIPDEPAPSLTSFVYYDDADEKPQMTGGLGDLYLRLYYPETARRRGIEGRLRIAFTVATDGTTHDLWVEQSAHPLLDASALKTLRETRFAPGRKNGQPVAVRMTLPIRFQLIYPATPIAELSAYP